MGVFFFCVFLFFVFFFFHHKNVSLLFNVSNEKEEKKFCYKKNAQNKNFLRERDERVLFSPPFFYKCILCTIVVFI